MKTFIASLLLVATAVGLSSAIGAGAPSAPDRPPGVAVNDWVPISDAFGLVLVRAAPSPVPATGLLLAPPAQGFFMVKRVAGWERVVIAEPVKGPGPSG
jgi:hypothetical protein